MDADNSMKALEWDANTEKVVASTTLDGTYTISAWVKRDAVGSYGYVTDFRTGGGTGYWNFDNSSPSVSSASSGTSYVNGASSPTTITAGTWNHVVVSGITIDSSSVVIGQANDTTGYTWDGYIASVSIYSGTKTASEVTELYDAGIDADESSNTNLVHYWKMDSASTVTLMLL